MIYTLIYLQNIVYPNSKAHSIQITKTLKSLSPYFKIKLITNGYSCKKSELKSAIKDKYGLELPEVDFVAISKKRLRGLRFSFSLKNIVKDIDNPIIFYTRSYNTAYRLIKKRRIHHAPIILESHKKDGYFKEERVSSPRYGKLLEDAEEGNTPFNKLKFIYENADGITFTSKTSERIVQNDLKISDSTPIWYPINFTKCHKEKDRDIVFCGALTPKKMEDLLLDSAQGWPKRVRIDILGGGGEENQERFMAKAKALGVAQHFRCYPPVPFKEINSFLKQYKFGLALMEGLKVIDYIANDVIPVLPRLNTYLDYLNENNAFFYTPYDPDSLTKILREIQELGTQSKDIKSLKETYELKSFGKNLSQFITTTAEKHYHKNQPHN